jgi:hypothetical protein
MKVAFCCYINRILCMLRAVMMAKPYHEHGPAKAAALVDHSICIANTSMHAPVQDLEAT